MHDSRGTIDNGHHTSTRVLSDLIPHPRQPSVEGWIDPELYMKSAFVLAQSSGDFWAAQKLLSAAVSAAPYNATYHVALGDVEAKLGRSVSVTVRAFPPLPRQYACLPCK